MCVRAGTFAIPEPSDRSRDDFKSLFFSEHPDVGIVAAYKRTILVDAIRGLEREAYFRPYEGAARVFLIDDADKMNDAASNALLKTLEEPARTSYIILITSRPHSLLQTIRSRCQSLSFAPVAADEIGPFLEKERGLSAPDAQLAAKFSAGSVARAVAIDLAKYRERRDEMLALLENAIVRRDLASMLRTGELMNDAKNKDDYEGTLEILEGLVRELWLLRKGMKADALANGDIAARMRTLAAAGEAPRLAGWLAAIDELRQSFAVNVNRKLATDALFVKMAGSAR